MMEVCSRIQSKGHLMVAFFMVWFYHLVFSVLGDGFEKAIESNVTP